MMLSFYFNFVVDSSSSREQLHQRFRARLSYERLFLVTFCKKRARKALVKSTPREQLHQRFYFTGSFYMQRS